MNILDRPGHCGHIAPRYCDDGWRCPGHPDWKPSGPHKERMANKCTDGIRLHDPCDGRLLVLGWLMCEDSSGKRPNLYPDYRRVG